jgi:hypothetical protein
LLSADLRSAFTIARDYATQAVEFDKRIVLAGIIGFIDIKSAEDRFSPESDAENNSS